MSTLQLSREKEARNNTQSHLLLKRDKSHKKKSTPAPNTIMSSSISETVIFLQNVGSFLKILHDSILEKSKFWIFYCATPEPQSTLFKYIDQDVHFRMIQSFIFSGKHAHTLQRPHLWEPINTPKMIFKVYIGKISASGALIEYFLFDFQNTLGTHRFYQNLTDLLQLNLWLRERILYWFSHQYFSHIPDVFLITKFITYWALCGNHSSGREQRPVSLILTLLMCLRNKKYFSCLCSFYPHHQSLGKFKYPMQICGWQYVT